MKHTIEIEGLPEGWEPVAYREPINEDERILYDGKAISPKGLMNRPWLILKKKQPRRIVLESTEETRQPIAGEYVFNNGNFCLCRKPERWGNEHEIWRRVEDTNSAPTEDLPEFLKPQAE